MSDEPRTGNVIFLSSLPAGIRLSDESRQSWVTLTRTGSWKHGEYGKFSITPKMLADMVANFEAGTYGQDILIDVGHHPDGGNAGQVLQLRVEGNRLRALIEWTPWGVKQVSEKGYRYFSVDFHDDWEDPETGRKHGPLLMGAALTNRPFVKRLDPVTLSEEFMPPGRRVFMHPELRRQLSEHVETTMKKYLEQLRKKLEARKLSEGVIKQLLDAAEQAGKALGEDEEALKALVEKFDATGKALAEQVGSGEVKLSIDLSGVTGDGDGGDGDGKGATKALTEEEVGAMVSKKLKEAEETAAAQKKQLAETLESRKKVYDDALEAAEGLDEATRKELSEAAADLITAEMSEDQVKRLAEFQISQANQVAAARQLASMGYADSRSGTPSVSVDDARGIKQLSEEIRKHLKGTTKATQGELRLPEKEHPFATRVLAEFDRIHAPQLERERRILLADGDVDTTRTDLPVSFQREVIREAFSDVNVLSLVQTLTDFGATGTTQIPYEESGNSADIANDGIVYEGQAIPNSGVDQKMDLAYLLPMKLAMKLTVEVMHLSRASAINWDAWARNVASNARIMRELIARRICNELQRVADGYAATTVTDEAVAGQLDGNNSIITLAQFPLVRPFQQRDLTGATVGDPVHPISLSVGGSAVNPWPGAGASAGTYYRVVSYNTAKLQLVDENGDPATPSTASATCSYSYATNVGKFDLDYDSAEIKLEKHLNGLLQKVGGRKALLDAERFVKPNFMLMSPVLNDTITNADNFVAHSRRDGTDTSMEGDLERVKGIPAFSTNAPGVDLGDERILMGIRGLLSYVVARPWSIEGQPFEAVNSDGRPTGQKVAYGVELNAIKVPKPLHGRLTSVIAYSGTDRTPYSP